MNDFFHLLKTEVPCCGAPFDQKRTRIWLLLALSLFCAVITGYNIMMYSDRSVSSSLGVLVILLLYLVTDLFTNDNRLAAVLTCFEIVPLFAVIILVGSSGIMELFWTLTIPAFLIPVCGLLPGTFAAGVMQLFLFFMFYTPLRSFLPSSYSQEIIMTYPLIYLFVFCLSFALSYDRQKRIRILYDDSVRAREEEKQATDKANLMVRETIMSIVNAVDAKDNYTRDHSIRVARYSAIFAERLGWEKNAVEKIYQIGLLHDIGKIGIEDHVLKNPSKLNKEEYEVMKTHTTIGESILRDLTQIPNASLGAAYHHERYDGKGYPHGLKGEEIPIEARIVCIADAFDAMTYTRTYKKEMDDPQVLEELRRGSGTQFDPVLVHDFLPVAEKLLQEKRTGII